MTEAEFIELCIWTTCESASGAGKGKCDPWHCVCGNEGTFLASKLWPIFAAIRAAEREATEADIQKCADHYRSMMRTLAGNEDYENAYGFKLRAETADYIKEHVAEASRIRARATDGRGE